MRRMIDFLLGYFRCKKGEWMALGLHRMEMNGNLRWKYEEAWR